MSAEGLTAEQATAMAFQLDALADTLAVSQRMADGGRWGGRVSTVLENASAWLVRPGGTWRQGTALLHEALKAENPTACCPVVYDCPQCGGEVCPVCGGPDTLRKRVNDDNFELWECDDCPAVVFTYHVPEDVERVRRAMAPKPEAAS